MITRSKSGVILGTLGVAAALWFEHQALTSLRVRNGDLQRQIEQSARQSLTQSPHSEVGEQAGTAPSLPSEQFRELLRLRGEAGLLRQQQEDLTRAQADNLQLRSNLLARTLDQEVRAVSREQVLSYLDRKGRDAESLLAAFSLLTDKTLLEEALAKYPNNPRVSLAAAFATEFRAQRRQSLDAFRQSDPDNALPSYLLAQEYFKSGQPAQALQQLADAATKPKFEDYSASSLRGTEELFRAAGYTDAAAKAAAWSKDAQSPLYDLTQLRRSLSDFVARSRQASDEESAQNAIQAGLQLGQRLADGPLTLKTEQHESVGLQIQRRLLETISPAGADEAANSAVKERLDEIARRRADIKDLSDPAGWGNYLLKTLSEQDLLIYFDRVGKYGEVEARRWAAQRQSHQ